MHFYVSLNREQDIMFLIVLNYSTHYHAQATSMRIRLHRTSVIKMDIFVNGLRNEVY